jgi:hypothetical protein
MILQFCSWVGFHQKMQSGFRVSLFVQRGAGSIKV